MAATRLDRIAAGAEAPLADIVFIHGLDGDGRTTWGHPDNSPRDTWLEWFAVELPLAAVWTVTYDAAASEWLGPSMPISQRAKSLLAFLAAYDVGVRPLIFITHSMGGLIVKQMMQIAMGQGASEFASIAKNTKLVVFISVPHQGARIPEYMEALRVIFRPTSAASAMQRDDDNLLDLNEWFRSFVQRSGVRIISFHEEAKTGSQVVVSRSSADFGFPDVLSIGETLDHKQISKPRTRDDIVYKRTIRTIKEVLASDFARAASADAQSSGHFPRSLKYLSATEIDKNCVEALLLDGAPAKISYAEELQARIEVLDATVRNPTSFLGSNPNIANMSALANREQVASGQFVYVKDVQLEVRAAVSRNEEALARLLSRIHELRPSPEHACRALGTFAALAALRVIHKLKSGFDWVEGAPRFWFEHYSFGSDPFPPYFDLVPEYSNAGRAVFGFRYWVRARVGHDRRYELITVPLKEVLPIFLDDVRGDKDSLWTWVFPQLVFTKYPLDEFPIEDWEAFTLHGAHGREWWSSAQESPWKVVSWIDMAEL